MLTWDCCSSEKGSGGHAMKLEALVLAALGQLLQVGLRGPPLQLPDHQPKAYPVTPASATCDCQCYCFPDSNTGPFHVVAAGLAGLAVGWLSTCGFQTSLSSPSPRRRGNGVIVRNSSWNSCSCVLL